MDIGEIISDAIVYPINNIKALILYIAIGVVGGIIGGAGLVGMFSAVMNGHALSAAGFGTISFIVLIIIGLLIQGYVIDIIKYGIQRRDDAPGIDLVRQVLNAIKLAIVGIVYYIIPAVIGWLLLTLLGNGILTLIIVFVLYVVFALAQFMAKCRLAKTDSLGEALAIGEAIGDISRVGFINILLLVIVVAVIIFVLGVILGLIYSFNDILGGIFFGILGVYSVFFYNRAVGLLYSGA